MNNFTQDHRTLYDEEPQILMHGEKPAHYLGYFDTTPELIDSALKVIKKTAIDFYKSNNLLFDNTGYSVEDLENEIHLKLLHKFKEQEKPFWVENLSNLKTISIFTLGKLIRILKQERRPETVSISSFYEKNEDMKEDDIDSNIFRTKESDNNLLDNIFLENILKDFTEYIRDLDVRGDYDLVFKYHLYLNNKIDLGLTQQEKSLIEAKFTRLSTSKDTTKPDHYTVKDIIKKLGLVGTNKTYLKLMTEFLEEQGLNPEKYKEEMTDQRKILRGYIIKNMDEEKEDIDRIISRGGILRDNQIIGLKDEVRRLNKIEKEANTNVRYKETNLRIVKYEMPRDKQERKEMKRARRQQMALIN